MYHETVQQAPSGKDGIIRWRAGRQPGEDRRMPGVGGEELQGAVQGLQHGTAQGHSGELPGHGLQA